MTMVLSRIEEIWHREKFKVWNIRRHGKLVRVTANGVMSEYDWGKMLKGGKTVNEWINERFKVTYPGFSCDILKGDGTVARPQTLLSTVRNTY